MLGCSIAVFIETIRTYWFIVSYMADLSFFSLGNKFGRSPYLMNSLFSTFFFWTPPTYINILNLTYLIPCLVCLSYGWPAIGSRRTSSDYSSYLQNKYKDVAALKSELFWDFKMLQWWLKIKLIPLEAIWFANFIEAFSSFWFMQVPIPTGWPSTRAFLDRIVWQGGWLCSLLLE